MRIALSLAATGAAMALGAPAKAEMQKIGESGFVSRHTATVAATPDAAWAALIEPSGWWNGAHTFSGEPDNLTLDPRALGCFCEMLPVGEGRSSPGSVRHMQVLFADPGTALRLSGALGPLQSEPVGAVLTVTLKQEDAGTRILFEYVVGGTMRYSVDQIGPAVDRVVGEQLASLAAQLGVAGQGPEAIELPASTAAEPEEAPAEMDVPATQVEQEAASFGADFLDDVDAAQAAVEEAELPPADADAPAEPLDEFDTR
ncbi:hypothetical protein [Croceicoccus naphthovorans]|uniref:hypothetical protein n=1 Tax=Croceicoccus naphthovorans TaxID=1348774 RepID=UPI00069E2157|nr:hypothetical protein [Croceicoccus naphthovorans]MBB3989615.1 hypothetical protein [Croceicoccus naphthovorans]